ncbi:FlgD immunoglobulin-like domain containing protein, partial [Candidatus Darwinibacter acetoxidans]
YNIKGQKVKTLANSLFQAGNHTLVWDGCSDEGEKLASGVYLLRMEAGKFRQTRKMTIIK